MYIQPNILTSASEGFSVIRNAHTRCWYRLPERIIE